MAEYSNGKVSSIAERVSRSFDRSDIETRVAVVAIALLILFLRMPGSFTNPQFWGEDAGVFYQQAYIQGWSSLANLPAGYLTFLQFSYATITSYFPSIAAPAIFNYGSFLVLAFIVWLTTSPRLEMPFRPLLAIALVVVPAGFEVLGTLTNTQWLIPIGAVALLFMRPSRSKFVLCCEAAFLAIVALTGPSAIFLTPLFLAWLWMVRDNLHERSRMILLAAVIVAGALIQIAIILANYNDALVPYTTAPVQYPWKLWLNLPLARSSAPIGTRTLASVGENLFLVPTLAAAMFFAVFAFREPYRKQKITMLIFGAAIMISGMIKYRANLPGAGFRYFYAFSVFSIWFFLCVPSAGAWKYRCAAIAAVAELIMVIGGANSPRIKNDLQWAAWSRIIDSGLPVVIPTSPPGWFLELPPKKDGPLAEFTPWIGQKLSTLVKDADHTSCLGELSAVAPADGVPILGSVKARLPQWMAAGWARGASQKKLLLIAVTDAADRVLGFGLLGFRHAEGSKELPGWMSSFSAPGPVVRAYAILKGDGLSACPLMVATRGPVGHASNIP